MNNRINQQRTYVKPEAQLRFAQPMALIVALGLFLTACGTSGTTEPEQIEAVSSVSSVKIESYDDSKQVSQGARVVFDVRGENLSNIAIAKLGEISGQILGNNTISARIQFDIPHNETRTPKELLLVTDAGQVRVEDAAIVTVITVSPEGDSVTGEGTPDNPFRSLSSAVKRARGGEGATITVANGTYNADNLETYPLTLSTMMTIKGESRDGVIYEGNGTHNCLNFRQGSSVSNITIRNCNVAIRHHPNGLGQSLELTNVVLNKNATGVLLENTAKATIKDLMALNNQEAGIQLTDTAELMLSDSVSSNNLLGLSLEDDSQAIISNSQLNENTTGAVLQDASSISLSSSQLSDNTSNGLSASGSGTIVIEGSIFNNNFTGIEYSSNAGQLKLRQTEVTDNLSHGLRISNDPKEVDLGTKTDKGNNTFGGNADFQLFDDRPTLLAPTGVIISAIGNDFAGAVLPKGTQKGTDEQVDGTNKVWRIDQGNQRIIFVPLVLQPI